MNNATFDYWVKNQLHQSSPNDSQVVMEHMFISSSANRSKKESIQLAMDSIDFTTNTMQYSIMHKNADIHSNSFNKTQSFRLPLCSKRKQKMFSNWRLLTTIKNNIELINLRGDMKNGEPDPNFSHTHLAPAMQLEHIKDLIINPAFSKFQYSQRTINYIYTLCISVINSHANTLLNSSIMSFTASCITHDPLTVVSSELDKYECVLRAAIKSIGGNWVNLHFTEKTTNVRDIEIGQLLFST